MEPYVRNEHDESAWGRSRSIERRGNLGGTLLRVRVGCRSAFAINVRVNSRHGYENVKMANERSKSYKCAGDTEGNEGK